MTNRDTTCFERLEQAFRPVVSRLFTNFGLQLLMHPQRLKPNGISLCADAGLRALLHPMSFQAL